MMTAPPRMSSRPAASSSMVTANVPAEIDLLIGKSRVDCVNAAGSASTQV